VGSVQLEKFLGVFFKFRETVMAAKKISLPVVEVASRGVARLHFHAADWIYHDKFFDAGGSLSLGSTGHSVFKQLKLWHDVVL
jgi:hypothetical protein